MIFLVTMVLSLIGAVMHLVLTQRPRTKDRVVSTLLLYMFAVFAGVGGLIGFLGHTVGAAYVAHSIGWPAGNPFQYEVGVANLAFAILGILCIWQRGGFWTAVGIGISIFLFGAAGVHLHQIHLGQDYTAANARLTLYTDIVAPIMILGLLALRDRHGD
jgi:hypothetical protein